MILVAAVLITLLLWYIELIGEECVQRKFIQVHSSFRTLHTRVYDAKVSCA